MKVLYLIDTLNGYGAEKSIVQIAIELKDVTPVFVHLYVGEKLKPELVKSGIKVYSLNIVSGHGFNKALQLLIPIIEKEKPQIIHTTLFRADMVGRKLKKKYPNLLLVGSFVSNSYGKKRYNNLSLISKIKLYSTQIRDRMSSKGVDFFICNSNAVMNSNIKALGVDQNKVEVIPRGRNLNKISGTKDEKLKIELGLKNKKIFLNVGRLIQSKGQLDLIIAFKALIDQHPDNILIIAGEGPYRQQLEKEIYMSNLKNKVILLGYRDNIPSLLSMADFFVFPSYFEGLPGALIEAIVAKKACIVSDIPENKECFPEEGAFFFPPGNVSALSFALEEALLYNHWEKKIEASFVYAEENFNILKISKRYEFFYKKALEKFNIEA